MSGLAWIIINFALVIGAAYGTIKVRNTPAPKPLQLEEPAKSEEESQHKASARNEKPAESKPSTSRPLTTNASMDDLWKQTLFFPTRTEDTGEDNAEHYAVKIEATKVLMENAGNTFVTPVFNGSTSLRDAAGQMIENVAKSVRRKEVVDDAYMTKLFDDVMALYHLDQLGRFVV